MNGLPQIPLTSEMVDVAGTKIEVRSLSRAEQVRLVKLADDVDAAEIALLALATGFTEDDIRAWREKTPGGVVGGLLDDVMRISALEPDAIKSGGTSVPPA